MGDFNAIIARRDWQRPEIFQCNRLPAHGALAAYHSAEAAMFGQPSDYVQSINGDWRFALYPQPEVVPETFPQPDFDDSDWVVMQVPSNWQLQGFDKPIIEGVGCCNESTVTFNVHLYALPLDRNRKTDGKVRSRSGRLLLQL